MSHRKMIVEKVTSVLGHTDPSLDKKLAELLADSTRRVFVGGAGRSGLIARFFGMRMMHAGYEVYIVGEVVTPNMKQDDLFIVITGSGESETMIAFSRRAKQLGAKVVAITAKDQSSVADMSDMAIVIGKAEDYEKNAAIPRGTTFELSSLIFLESIIEKIIADKGIPEEEMRKSFRI